MSTRRDPNGDTTSGVGRQPGANLGATAGGDVTHPAYRLDTDLDTRERMDDASADDLGGSGKDDAGQRRAHPSMADVRSDMIDDGGGAR